MWLFSRSVVETRDEGNHLNRFEKIDTGMNFQYVTLYLVYLVSSCFLCGYFPDPLWKPGMKEIT